MSGLSLNSVYFNQFVSSVIGFSVTSIVFVLSRVWQIEKIFEPGVVLIVFYIKNIVVDKKALNVSFRFILYGIIAFVIVHLIYISARSFTGIPEWDFPCFFLFGKVGVSGGNFYDPSLFLDLYEELCLYAVTSGSFTDGIVNVGFWYPPPTMFIFYPLGLFDIHTAYILWQGLIVVFLFADIYLLIKVFGGDLRLVFYDSNKLVLVVVILLFPLLQSSIWFSQTNGILLFLTLLMISNIGHWRNGILLCLMVLIKPLFVLLGVYFLIRRDWRIIWVFFISGVLILVLTGFAFGFDIFNHYFNSPPTVRIPSYVYLETLNQSLNSVLLRIQNNASFSVWPSYKFFTYLFSVALLVFLIYITFVIHRKDRLLSFLLFLPVTLLIYPATLSHYIIFLIPLVAVLFKELKTTYGDVALQMVAVAYLIGSTGLFWFNILLIVVTIHLLLGVKLGLKKR